MIPTPPNTPLAPRDGGSRGTPKKRTALLLGLACLFGAASCNGLEVEPEPIVHPDGPLSLDEAVELALRNHPDVRIARERVLQAIADVDVSSSALWPDVSVGANFTRTDAPSRVFGQLLDQGEFRSGIDFNDPGTHSNLRTEVAGGLTLYDGGRRRARLQRAEARREASAAAEEEVRALIALEVAAAWHRTHASRAAAVVAAREAPVLEELLVTAEVELENGTALPLAVEELRSRLSSARNASHTAEVAARRAQSSLTRLLGLGVEESVELRAPIALDAEPLPALEELLQRARFERAELSEAQYEIEAALAGLREAEAGYLPEIGVGAALGFDDQDARFSRSNWLFGAGLVESVTEALRTPRRVRGAASALRIAHEAGRRSLLAVEGEVESAWLDAGEAGRALRLAREERSRAARTLQRTEAEFELGAARSTTLSLARLADERASTREHVATLRNAQARVALAHAVGSFPSRPPRHEEEQP